MLPCAWGSEVNDCVGEEEGGKRLQRFKWSHEYLHDVDVSPTKEEEKGITPRLIGGHRENNIIMGRLKKKMKNQKNSTSSTRRRLTRTTDLLTHLLSLFFGGLVCLRSDRPFIEGKAPSV